ncbi:MAG: UDP-2,3-diacylglucosamine diphosphatase LpxI [Fuerstiella sp.]
MKKPIDNPTILPFPADRVCAGVPDRLGLLAGSGHFPVQFVRNVQASGRSVFCVGIRGMATAELAAECDEFRLASLARIGRAIRLFQKADVDHIVMAGRIHRTVLFDSFRWLRLLPDRRTLHMWYRYLRKGRRRDTMLRALIREFARDGMRFESALDYAPDLVVKHGFLTHRKPTAAQWRDVQFGWEVATAMARLEVGQTVVVQDNAVIAVEALEGMDACITRAGLLSRRGGFTVVRIARPQQDGRFDLPTIGIETIKMMHQAGGRVLAIEAGQTVILDAKEVAALADRFGIAIVAVNAEEVSLRCVA